MSVWKTTCTYQLGPRDIALWDWLPQHWLTSGLRKCLRSGFISVHPSPYPLIWICFTLSQGRKESGPRECKCGQTASFTPDPPGHSCGAASSSQNSGLGRGLPLPFWLITVPSQPPSLKLSWDELLSFVSLSFLIYKMECSLPFSFPKAVVVSGYMIDVKVEGRWSRRNWTVVEIEVI